MCAKLFFVDTDAQPSTASKATLSMPGEDVIDDNGPAWDDSDDDKIHVSLASASRLRKLRKSESEDVVTGREYIRRLRQQ